MSRSFLPTEWNSLLRYTWLSSATAVLQLSVLILTQRHRSYIHYICLQVCKGNTICKISSGQKEGHFLAPQPHWPPFCSSAVFSLQSSDCCTPGCLPTLIKLLSANAETQHDLSKAPITPESNLKKIKLAHSLAAASGWGVILIWNHQSVWWQQLPLLWFLLFFEWVWGQRYMIAGWLEMNSPIIWGEVSFSSMTMWRAPIGMSNIFSIPDERDGEGEWVYRGGLLL